MMKKYIAMFIAILTLSLCLSFTVSAAGDDFTISEDFQSITLNGIHYTRMDTSRVSSNYNTRSVDETPQLTHKQQELLRDATFEIIYQSKIIEAQFFFRDGATLTCSFVSDEYRQQLNEYLTDDQVECYIEFYWNDGKSKEIDLKQFKGTPVTLERRTLRQCETFPVFVSYNKENLTIIRGCLLVAQDRFYYVDYAEADIHESYVLDVYEYDTLDCHEITDPELLSYIEDSMGSYYDVAYNSGQFLDIASFIFWAFIFAVIPMGILVVSVIFCIKGKGYYRITWGVTAGLCVAELIMYFTVVARLLMSA
jgi:hypothetical protein